MVVTLIIDIRTSSFAVDIQLSHNFYFAGVVSETQNRWLFEVWGPAGMLLEQELAEGWKVEGIAPMTQDEHYWGWGQTPAPHHLCAPLQSSASLLCSRQPAHKCLRLVLTALETPWSEGNMTLLHPHRCSSSSTCPSSAVSSGMRMRRFWPFSHLKCFAPWSRIQEIMCSSLYRVCQWWRPSCSTPSQWMDLQDSFFSIEFLSLSKESEV